MVFAFEVVLGGFGGIVFVIPTLIAVGIAGFVTYELVGHTGDSTRSHRWRSIGTPPAPLSRAGAPRGDSPPSCTSNFLKQSKPIWARVPLPPLGRMVLAGALVGLVAVWLPEVMGTGTATMKDLFGGATIPLGTLLALAIAETILTPSSLGSGFVGGVIGPSMLIGSTLGAAVGIVVAGLFPDLGLSPVVFAMVGTAAMLAGSFHAPIFGALMVFEMAGSYEMLVPLVLAAAIGYAVAATVPAGVPPTRLPSTGRASSLPRARSGGCRTRASHDECEGPYRRGATPARVASSAIFTPTA